ncbi:MAG TPA: TolC family protein [Thermoanaerobaculia bacterium]|nr:TolC family protein [Thermoanaerobaculia bacterium]
MTRRILPAVILGLGLSRGVSGQAGNAAPPEAVRFGIQEYVRAVLANNPDLAAERENVAIARAQVDVARIVPDPSLSIGSPQYDISNGAVQNEVSAALSGTLELGGKRSARVGLAQANALAAGSDLANAVRQLRAAAANAYVDAVRARLVLDRKRQTLESLDRLVEANQARLAAGDVAEVVLLQARVSAQQFRGEVAAAKASVQAADLALLELLGRSSASSDGKPIALTSDLHLDVHAWDADALIARALAERPDLQAVTDRQLASDKQLALIRADRAIDLSPSIGWTHVYSGNGAPPAPAGDFLVFGVGVPLPFSRLHKGDLEAARAGQEQARANTTASRVHVEIDVRQAIARCEAAGRQVLVYESGTLADADRVFEKTLYSFQRGAATVVEVLIAQQTDDEVHIAYDDALAERARALIALQEAVGTSDWP